MELTKLINDNPLRNFGIATTISEYDIKSAHPTAMKFIKGDAFHKELMEMPKLQANITIGKMIKEDPSLNKSIEELVLKWMNKFLYSNNIKDKHFINTTRDSIMIVGKIATKTKFERGSVLFRDKDGSYTSFYKLGRILILFDSMTRNIKIKGISDDIVNDSPFIKGYLKSFLFDLESSSSLDRENMLYTLTRYRNRYLKSKNEGIYKCLTASGNHFENIIDGKIVNADYRIGDNEINMLYNYQTYVMPIMRYAYNS